LRLPLLATHGVRVDTHRDSGIGMAQQGLHGFDVLLVGREQGRLCIVGSLFIHFNLVGSNQPRKILEAGRKGLPSEDSDFVCDRYVPYGRRNSIFGGD
jgi:hypothetical protein